MGYDKFNLVHVFDEDGEQECRHTVSFDEEQLDRVVDHMEDFLRGCGFVFDGHLVIDQCAGCDGCDDIEEDE